MGKHERKKGKRQSPPVTTGNDLRAENRSRNKDRPQTSDAPDGVSGNWS